tara:strand:- start:4342 stop:5835 length:1494 start_codon:yes stop_codon:yes gene_type:complete
MAEQDPYEGIRNGNTPGSYDIVRSYDWTSIPKNSQLRNEAPSAYITAYELEYSQLRSFIDGYMNILSPQNSTGAYSGKGAGLDFYKGLYSVDSTPIARFNFPFFGDSFRSFSSEFADTFSPISQRGAQMFGGKEIQGLFAGAESLVGGGIAAVNALASFGDNTGGNIGGGSLADKVAKNVSGAATTVTNKLGLNPGMQTIGAPGTYIETPKFYQYSNTDNGIQIAFTLSNTLDDDSIEKNFKFICDFTKINRPYRYGPIGMTFPAIYNLVVPGLRYIQWASLEGFDVSLLGNRRKIGDHIIPEAYVCQFNFRSLTVEPSNFIDEICEGSTMGGGKFSTFSEYNKDRLEEEVEIQKGKDVRRRKLQSRRELFEAQNQGEQQTQQPFIPGQVSQQVNREGSIGNQRRVFLGRDENGNPIYGGSTTTSASPSELENRRFQREVIEQQERLRAIERGEGPLNQYFNNLKNNNATQGLTPRLSSEEKKSLENYLKDLREKQQ